MLLFYDFTVGRLSYYRMRLRTKVEKQKKESIQKSHNLQYRSKNRIVGPQIFKAPHLTVATMALRGRNPRSYAP